MGNGMGLIKEIQNKQKTIDDLLQIKDSCKKMSSVPGNNWVLEPIYKEADCDIGFVHIDNLEAGPCEEHIHDESKEFLIVIKGRLALYVNGSFMRNLREGDIAVIHPNECHYSRPLVNGTKLVYVCVPADRGMEKLRKSIEGKV